MKFFFWGGGGHLCIQRQRLCRTVIHNVWVHGWLYIYSTWVMSMAIQILDMGDVNGYTDPRHGWCQWLYRSSKPLTSPMSRICIAIDITHVEDLYSHWHHPCRGSVSWVMSMAIQILDMGDVNGYTDTRHGDVNGYTDTRHVLQALGYCINVTWRQ